MKKHPLTTGITGDYQLFRNPLKLLSESDRWRRIARQLRLSKAARHRLEWFIYHHHKARKCAALTIRYFGISKSVFYKWLAAFDPANLRSLESGSQAPLNRRRSIIPRVKEERILSLRQANPEYGKMKLKAIYERDHCERISAWRIQLVIEKYHLQRRPRPADRHFKKQSLSKRKTITLKRQEKPGFLVAFDTIEIHRNGKRRYIITGIDTVSKVAWARMYSSHSSATTRDLFIRLYAVVKGNVLNICQDNGSEFEKHFAAALASLDIPQYFSRVKTPKDNPVCERFNRTLKEEFLRQGNWTADIRLFNQKLSRWLLKYNLYRPHQSLNYLTPFQYHYRQAALSTM